MTDDGFTAEDGGTRVNGDIVLDGRMALHAVESLTAPGGEGTDGDALVDLHVLTDDGGGAHHDAGAVVHHEIFADGGAGMDVDAGDGVGIFRHHTGNEGHPQQEELVGDAVDGAGPKSRIGENDLFLIVCGRIAVKGSLEIGIHIFPDHRDPLEEGDGGALGLLLHGLRREIRVFRTVLQRDGGLLVQVVHDVLHQHGEPVGIVVGPQGFVPVVAGVDDAEQLLQDVHHRFPVRLTENVHPVDVSAVMII